MTMAERQRWVLALTSTASLMISLDALVVTTALHAIALDLHASIADLEWTVNAYTLSFAVLLIGGAAQGVR
jgi:MFS family permease